VWNVTVEDEPMVLVPFVGSAGGVGAAVTSKLAAQIARRIEADILASGWQVGTVFGSESDLRERYGVSRAVLREAIRLVEHHEVAVMRRGPSGGLVVRAPESGALTTAMAIYLEHVGTSVEDLLAVRILLEPLAARLAADRLTEGGVDALREALRQEAELAPTGSAFDLLHLTLGQLSGNAALRLFIDVLAALTARYGVRPTTPEAEASAVKAASDHAHHAISDAIIAGDTGLAEMRAVRHLEAMREWLLSVQQQPIVNVPGEGPEDDRGSAARENGDGGKQKLAETVARRMMSDIVASGAGVGEVVGSEADLLQRYGVSRAVLREAVRLLEYHSVARMRRGPGGGLVVAQPDATASIEAMAIYLDFEKIGAEDLRVVRDVIEMGCLERVTERAGDPVVVARLEEALRTESSAPQGTVEKRAHHVHTELAELSGNPVLALFLRIITTVWARHTHSVDDYAPESQETAEYVAHAHQRIVEAVLAGDIPLARHRMRRHLDALDVWWE
jgi:DNA-binding FadR family transcriptional regulator